MDTKTALLGLEEGFWRAASDRDRYAANLSRDAIHVFPGWGVSGRGPVLEAVAEAEPWESFAIDDPTVLDLGPDAAALVYTAHARRRGEPEYRAAITSVYRRDGDGWKLALHQQTPLEAG